MPKKNKADLTYREKAEHFLRKYVTKGKLAEYIPWCELQAGLKPGEGEKILNRDWAIQKLQALDGPIRTQQITQAVLSEAEDLVRDRFLKEARRLTGYELDIPKIVKAKYTEAMLFSSNPYDVREFGDRLLKIGEIQGENAPSNATFNVYQQIFQDKGKTPTPSPNPSESSPYASEQPPAPLYPDVTQPLLDSGPVVLPPQGESIDESEAKKPDNSKIITVEVS